MNLSAHCRPTCGARWLLSKSPSISALVLSFLLYSCCTPRGTVEGGGDDTGGVPLGYTPGTAHLYGTVMEIKRTRFYSDTSNPCSKHPCRASVRIDSVAGYGVGFPEEFSRGQRIVVSFALTLDPTDTILPNLRSPLPGLETGSSFEADLYFNQGPFSGQSSLEDGSMTVYFYRKM